MGKSVASNMKFDVIHVKSEFNVPEMSCIVAAGVDMETAISKTADYFQEEWDRYFANKGRDQLVGNLKHQLSDIDQSWTGDCMIDTCNGPNNSDNYIFFRKAGTPIFEHKAKQVDTTLPENVIKALKKALKWLKVVNVDGTDRLYYRWNKMVKGQWGENLFEWWDKEALFQFVKDFKAACDAIVKETGNESYATIKDWADGLKYDKKSRNVVYDILESSGKYAIRFFKKDVLGTWRPGEREKTEDAIFDYLIDCK